MDSNKLSFKEKLAFGIGDAGCNFVWTTVSAFLTLYYTDSVGIAAGVVGTLMLITRLLDGATDIVFGTILDKTRTRWGKARPWILISIPLMALGLILLFNVPGGLSDGGKTVYAFITYIFVAAIAYTICNLAYNALLSLMTNDQKSRTSASSLRFICTMLAALAITSFTMTIVNKIGWTGTSIIYAVLASVCLLITFLGTKERAAINNPNGTDDKIPILQGFKYLFKNRYFYSIALLFVVVYAGSSVSSGIGIYFVRDIMGNENLLGVLSLSGMLPMLAGFLIFPTLATKFGKWKCMLVGMVLQIIGSVIILTNSTSLVIVVIGAVIKGIGAVPNTAGLFALVADGVEYGEWKNNVRQDGLFNSATSFGMKVGTGVGTALVGWGLSLGKYDANLAVQAAGTLTAIKILYAGIPIICTLLALVFLGLSNIDKIYPQIEKDLRARKIDS